MAGTDKSFTINIKSGKMYIGDLCYALSDDIYDGVWGNQGHYEDGKYETQNGEFAMVGTAYGDGCYPGSDGMEYPVDAGIIGICDASLVNKDVHGYGTIVDATGEANISYEDGTIAITYDNNGATKFVNIETSEDWDDEDFEDEEEPYDDEEEEDYFESASRDMSNSLINEYLNEGNFWGGDDDDSNVAYVQVRGYATEEDFKRGYASMIEADDDAETLFNECKKDVDNGEFYAIVTGDFSCKYDRDEVEYDDRFIPIKTYPEGLDTNCVSVTEALNEAHYDPADYWHEDPYWYRKPHGGVKTTDADDELMARAEAKYGDAGDYSHFPKKPAPAKPSAAAMGPATKDYTDSEAAKQFYDWAKKNVIDYDSFHKAYDDALKAAGCPTSIFGSSGSLNNSRTWNQIKVLDASLSSVRALKKLWGLQFKSDAKSLARHKEDEEKHKVYQHERDLLAAIRERVKAHPEIFNKDEQTKKAKFNIEKQDENPAYLSVGRAYPNNNGCISIGWKEDVNYDVCYGDSVTVRYPDIDNFMNTDVNTLADYFIDQIKNDDWCDGLGYHKFKDGSRDV